MPMTLPPAPKHPPFPVYSFPNASLSYLSTPQSLPHLLSNPSSANHPPISLSGISGLMAKPDAVDPQNQTGIGWRDRYAMGQGGRLRGGDVLVLADQEGCHFFYGGNIYLGHFNLPEGNEIHSFTLLPFPKSLHLLVYTSPATSPSTLAIFHLKVPIPSLLPRLAVQISELHFYLDSALRATDGIWRGWREVKAHEKNWSDRLKALAAGHGGELKFFLTT
jgi:hypothetical protein